MNEFVPTNFTAKSKSARLVIEWNDGLVSEVPYDLLRSACPCAQCRGGHENMHPEPEPDVFMIPLMSVEATRLKNITPVGNYAINLEWQDGHKHGIYNWHYLRVLCDQMRLQEELDQK